MKFLYMKELQKYLVVITRTFISNRAITYKSIPVEDNLRRQPLLDQILNAKK